ncbi:MAG TPA: ABC transporter permease [Chloroflexota bacterium]|nr:ABC transporter permease [Chloroflexota bacterium]
MALLRIARLTLRETARRKLLIALVILTVIVALLTGWLFHKLYSLPCGEAPHLHRCTVATMDLAAATLLILLLFMFSFVLALGAAFVAAPSIATEIESGVLLSIATRPIRRSDILLGKWLGFAVLLALYGALAIALEMVILKVAMGYAPPHPVAAIAFIIAESLIVLTLAMLGSTRLSAITTGIIALALFGGAWLAGITGEVGQLFGNRTIENAGTVGSLIMPTDGLWRGAIYNLEPLAVILGQADLGQRAAANPFFVLSAPSPPYLLWALAWGLAVLGLALWSFQRREL